MALLTTCWLSELFLILVGMSLCSYISIKIRYQYWKKRGVPEVEDPSIPFGNFRGIAISESIVTKLQKLYEKGKHHKVFGAFLFWQPIMIVTDLDLIKNILVKDFASFRDRGFEIDEHANPLFKHLFVMKGQEWRNMRIKLTPTFTSGKMRMMYPTMFEVGTGLEKILNGFSDGQEVEVKDILSRYTIDVITKVAFGIDISSLENPDVPIRKMTSNLTNPSIYQAIMAALLFLFPSISKKIAPIKVLPESMSEFFIKIVRDVMDYRLKNNIHRNDFMQLLLQLRTMGYIPDADNPKKTEEAAQEFTVEQAAAQAFIFFFAGFETTSSTLQFALYELALSPDVQQLLQEEIDSVNSEYKGAITYDILHQMDYLDRVISETLRKYPVAAIIVRECNTDYKIPDSDLTIEKGTKLYFPLNGYQTDPNYYPDPGKFDPDRFLPEEIQKRPHFAYLPFGEGPRSCIGARFALMQAKAGLFIIMAAFRVAPSKRTPIPMVLDPKTNMAPNGKMHLALTRRRAKKIEE